MRKLLLVLVSIVQIAAPVAAQYRHGTRSHAREIGVETTISYANNGGLRDWQRGPNRAGYLFVRDRREQWYRVTLTGPCRLDLPLDTLIYTTDVNGTFDRFSRLRVASFPQQVCGVRSIKTSAPPPGQVGLRPFHG